MQTHYSCRMTTSAEEILVYWFAECEDSPEKCSQRNSWWFSGGTAVDREITERFSDDVAAAACGKLDTWQGAAKSCLALVLLLDQFPRNIYRGTPQAFANDDKSIAIIRTGIARAYLEQLKPPEACFFLTPFMHAENLEIQEEGIALLESLNARCAPQWRERVANALHFASEHADVIRRFGRFPHRNAVLGRASTEVEREFLDTGATGWGQ